MLVLAVGLWATIIGLLVSSSVLIIISDGGIICSGSKHFRSLFHVVHDVASPHSRYSLVNSCRNVCQPDRSKHALSFFWFCGSSHTILGCLLANNDVSFSTMENVSFRLENLRNSPRSLLRSVCSTISA